MVPPAAGLNTIKGPPQKRISDLDVVVKNGASSKWVALVNGTKD